MVSKQILQKQPNVSTGHYAEKHKKASFLRWSHDARFQKARELISPLAGSAFLDYGCGDATFMRKVEDLYPNAVGSDLAKDQIEDCNVRLGGSTDFEFHTSSTMNDVSWNHHFAVATCLEVLEHCPDVAVHEVLRDLTRLVKPGGLIVISVPIEIGPTLIGKQFLRTIAAWKGIHDYRFTERYSILEFLKMLFATSSTRFDRPVYGKEGVDNLGYHGHKGFNWRRLRETVQGKMHIETVDFSPMKWSGSLINSQAWFICRNHT